MVLARVRETANCQPFRVWITEPMNNDFMESTIPCRTFANEGNRLPRYWSIHERSRRVPSDSGLPRAGRPTR